MDSLSFGVALWMVSRSAESRDPESLIQSIHNFCCKFSSQICSDCGGYRSFSDDIFVDSSSYEVCCLVSEW